jgi:cation diffusion facilitator family transporter
MESYAEVEKTAEKEKKLVALSSVFAAIFITAFKLVIGLFTHSLGILAEAAHSALDLVAAAVTFFAVRISGRAPDEKLMFGYGKVENLSALFETLLLLLTCVWIIYEAVQRLFFKSVQVEVSIWSFIVMLTSIVIDVTRSRALMKAAKKHGSQALEADALHFSTDVWSSAVVIGGLVLITIGELLKKYSNVPEVVTTWLHRADAIAALGVSIIVIYVSIQLGKRTIQGLLDEAPQGLHQEILGKVSTIPGLLKVRQIRIRPSGPSTFVDMILEIPRAASLEEAHNISVEAKKIVKSLITRVDVIIHLDPMVVNRDSIVESVQSVVSRSGLDVHSIRVFENESQINLDMHIEVPDTLTIAEAHERVSHVEAKLRDEIPNLAEISSHIEPIGDHESRRLVDVAESDQIRAIVNALPETFPTVSNCHNIILYKEGENLSLSFHCTLPPTISITDAHRLTSEMEKRLRQSIPEIDRIYIHTEPIENDEAGSNS